MRVTNERAERDIATYKYNEGKTHIVMSKPIEDRYKYAADLLEARELIKEMRDLANLIHEVAINPVLQSSKTGREESIVACEVMSEKILEKSKEYAE